MMNQRPNYQLKDRDQTINFGKHINSLLEFEFAFQIEFEIELEFQRPNYQLKERDQSINFGKETKPSALGNRLNHQLLESD